jgi:hypothetical protein
LYLLRHNDVILIGVYAKECQELNTIEYNKIYRKSKGWRNYNIHKNVDIINKKILHRIDMQKNNLQDFIGRVDLKDNLYRLF